MSTNLSALEAGQLDEKTASLNTSGVGAEPLDEKSISSNVVNWNGEDDQLNPMNWEASKKWRNLLIIALMTLSTPLASTMFAPGLPQVMAQFHSNNINLATIVVSIFVLGFAFGPLLIAPLCENYGRRPTYIVSNFVFIIFTIACALSTNLGMLIAFRFLAGCAGSAPITIGGASIGDMFSKEKRGAAMAIWGLGPLLGPVIGPVIGGFLVQAKGWRWAFWVQAIVAATTLILGTIFLRETYAVVILEKKTKALRKETGNIGLVSALHDGLPLRAHIYQSLIRPVKLLLTSPIVIVLSTYIAFVFGYLYLFVTTIPEVFQQQYGFSTSAIGLSYLGLGIGLMIGLVISGKSSDAMYKKLTTKNNGVAEPEFRLPPMIISGPLMVVAFFWYGWSAQEKTHWIVPIIGTVFFGMAMMPVIMSLNMYLVHTYGRYSASALAATKVFQSIGGCVLPLIGLPLYDRLGLGWGNTVLAFIALLSVPVPWILIRYGAVLRRWSGVEEL